MNRASGVRYGVFVFLLTIASQIPLAPPCQADGLPGDYLVTQRWRALLSPYSSLSNPAFLAEENFLALRGSLLPPPLNNSFAVSELGVTIPIGLDHSLGFSWVRQGEQPYSGYDLDFNETDMIQFQSNSFQASYAVNFWRRLCFGANITAVYQDLFQEETRFSIPPGVDVGLSYRITNHPILGNHIAGLMLQNLLAPTLSGEADAGEIFSRNARLSWLSWLWEKKVETGIDVDVKDFLAEATEFLDGGSAIEYEVSGRVGVWLMRLFKLHAMFGMGENNLAYWGIAGGLNAPTLNVGRDLSFVYQYNMMLQGAMSESHTIYARVELGKHREEIYARKMAKLLDSSPNDLYNKALTLYYAGKYWDAFWVFGQILAQFPDFFKNDWVKYYFHNCQEKLDMRTNSFAGYTQTIADYPKSDAVAHANLGLMRIAYRESAFETVEKQHERMTQAGVPDSLRWHAYYLMGQTRLKQGSYAQAQQLFSEVPEGHPQFAFARHSLAVAHFMLNQTESAMGALDAVAGLKPSTAEEKEVVNRSLLFMGYLYYEEGELSKAVAALRSVPASSYYYEDALLGLGWAGLRARQWGDCTQAGQALVKTSNKPAVQCEGLLLQAYAALMDKKYSEAASTLREAAQKSEGLVEPPDDSLNERRQTYRVTRLSYDSLAGNAEDLAQNRLTSQIAAMTDSMHVPQTEIKARIDSFLVYADEFERFSFFARNISKLKSDVEYALATSEKLAGSSKQLKEQDKEMEKLKDVQQEMDRIQQEIKKIEGKDKK